jgi:hypothetical protein
VDRALSEPEVSSLYNSGSGRPGSSADSSNSDRSMAYQSGELLFEDNWPQDGDFDLNDQTVAHGFAFQLDSSGNVSAMHATFRVLSAGAALHNGLYLHLPLPGGTPLIATDQDGNPVLPSSARETSSSRPPPTLARSSRPSTRSSIPCPQRLRRRRRPSA